MPSRSRGISDTNGPRTSSSVTVYAIRAGAFVDSQSLSLVGRSSLPLACGELVDFSRYLFLRNGDPVGRLPNRFEIKRHRVESLLIGRRDSLRRQPNRIR